MPGPRSSLADTLLLTDAERATLEQWQRAPTLPSGLVRRGRMILLLADGHSVSETARRVGVERWIVRQWARRFQADRLAGLTDRPRSGRPPVFPPGGRRPHGGPGLHPAG
jgi:winged helix-turn helix protein